MCVLALEGRASCQLLPAVWLIRTPCAAGVCPSGWVMHCVSEPLAPPLSRRSEPRQPGLSARQWVLALFGVAFIALQLLILWHLTALPPPAVAPVAAAAVKLAASAHAGAKQPVRAQRAATSAASQQRHLECPGALSAATSLAHLQHQLNLLSSQVAAMVADAGPGSSPEASDSSSHAEL